MEPMTRQEVFDTVATHLMTQRERASLNGQCQYKDPEGLKCAVGCLIPDDVYSPQMEGKSVRVLLASSPGIMLRPLAAHLNMLSSLQDVHDRVHVSHWSRRLFRIAETYGLSPAVLKAFETSSDCES